MTDASKIVGALNNFIALANQMTNEEELDRNVVSTALMRACAVYSTFVVTGNDGALKESGVEKLTKLFSEELVAVQNAKIAQAKQEGTFFESNS
ncbi:MAG: DUF3144 domain-containing protein [Pseudomonadales bacterium]|nr:DUF3144 domain-containing protein [Pseudomonadales bacterium]